MELLPPRGSHKHFAHFQSEFVWSKVFFWEKRGISLCVPFFSYYYLKECKGLFMPIMSPQNNSTRLPCFMILQINTISTSKLVHGCSTIKFEQNELKTTLS